MHGNKGKKQLKEHIEKRLKNQSLWKKTKYWLGKHHTEEERKQISETKKKSDKTPRGEKHHNWKGGISSEINNIRGSLEYILWRDAVYKRDNWTCRICGEHCKKGNIVAHHLQKFSEFPELRFIIDNGLTLCRKCHAEIENPQHNNG